VRRVPSMTECNVRQVESFNREISLDHRWQRITHLRKEQLEGLYYVVSIGIHNSYAHDRLISSMTRAAICSSGVSPGL
jgi:hypothetical protein